LKFFENIFGSHRKEEEKAEYSLDELESMLKTESETENRAAYYEAKPILSEVYESFERIHELALRIKETDCPEDVNPRLTAVIRTTKPEFAREITEAIKDCKKEAGLEEEKKAINETMDLIAKAVMGPGKYLRMAYAEDMEEIGRELKTLAEDRKELEKTSCSRESDSLIQEIEHIKSLTKHKAAMEAELHETEKKLSNLREKKETLKKKTEDLEKGKEYASHLQKKEELQEKTREKEEKENRVYNLISPLKRPLKILENPTEKTAA